MRFFVLLTVLLFCSGSLSAQSESESQARPEFDTRQIEKPFFKPFIERFILDELKSLRQEQQAMRADLVERVANARLEVSDRAIRYTADTTANIFYMLTLVASFIVLLGWKSFREVKESVEVKIEQRVDELTLKYEKRLNALEATITERTNQIVANQKEIADSNLIHSLWMRAGLEKSDQEKIKIYDQILEISPNDIEALTYKADVLLDMNEDSWALSLVNQAIEHDGNYALAYWQRACARAKLEQYDEALEDIQSAIALSASLRDELVNESYFGGLQGREDFQSLLG